MLAAGWGWSSLWSQAGRCRAVKGFRPGDTTLPGFQQAGLVPKPGAQRVYSGQGVPGSVSIPLNPLGRISALCSPITPHRLCLSPFFLFLRRKKGTPRGRRKKAPLFRTKKLPSLPQLRTRRWRCQGRVATRRRWQRRQKVRQVRAVAGNVLSSAGSAASSRAANVSTHRGLSPQSHTEVTLSHSTRGILDASGFHACKECPGSLPSSCVWMDG